MGRVGWNRVRKVSRNPRINGVEMNGVLDPTLRPLSRIIIHSGTFLILLGFFHWGIWLVQGVEWEGPLSIRKPILFGFSAGVTTWSIAWVVRRLPAWRLDQWINSVFSLSLVMEVLLIVMQYWRGVGSHFNRQTPFDAAVFSAMGLLIQIISICLVIWTLRGFGRLQCSIDEKIAVRVGMPLILLSCLVGAFMISYGQERIAAGQPPEIYGAHGVLKFLHGVPLHSIQWLIVGCWLGRIFALAERDRVLVVSLISISQVMFTGFAAVQVFSGRDRFELGTLGIVLLMAAILFLTASVVPLVRALVYRRLSTAL